MQYISTMDQIINTSSSHSTESTMTAVSPAKPLVPRRTRSLGCGKESSPHPSPYEPSDWDEQAMHPAQLSSVLDDLNKKTLEYGPFHPIVADHWNSLGLIRFHMQRNVLAAIKCHQIALDIYRRNGMAVQQAVCLSDLAACYERTRDCAKAIALYQQAYELLGSLGSHKSCVHLSISRSLARLQRH